MANKIKKVTKTKKEKLGNASITTKKETEFLDEEISLAIVSKFSIVEIKMKNDWRWKVKMLVHETLPKAYRDYAIKLEFDDRPFLKTIEQLEKEVQEISRNPSLLPDVDRKSMKQIDDKIASTKAEMYKLQRECPDIEFVTQSEEIKYKDGDTALLFKVLDSVIQPLNEKKFRLNDYRAVLDPIIK